MLVTYYSIDNAGNSADEQSAVIWVDPTPPVVTLSMSGSVCGGFYNTTATASIRATDTQSGVQSIYANGIAHSDNFQLTYPASGSYTLQDVYAVDWVGNASTPLASKSFQVDVNAPLVSLSGMESNGGFLFRIPHSDDFAGIAEGKITIRRASNNGVVIRELPFDSSVVWDGKDSSGAAVSHNEAYIALVQVKDKACNQTTRAIQIRWPFFGLGGASISELASETPTASPTALATWTAQPTATPTHRSGLALGKASPTPSSSAPARATVTPNPLTLTAFAQQTAFAVQTVGAAGQVSATPSPTDGEAQQNASQSTPLALAQLYPTANTPNPAESLSKNPDVRKVEQYKTEKPSFLYPNRPTDGGAAAVGLPGIALAAGIGLGTIAASDKRRKNAGLVMAGAALVGGVALAGVVGAVEAQTQTSAQPSHAPVIFQDPNQPTCGAASLAMAMGAWGKDAPSQAEILAFMQANNLQHEYGTGVEELAYTARQMGFEGSYYFCNGSFATIADEVSKGHPVQVSIQLEGYAQPTGHFVTITSISDSVVTYNDPLKGAVELPRAEFEKAWQANGGCAVVVLDEPLADTPASRAPLFAGIGAAVALGGLALLGTESRTGTGAGSTNKATGSKDPSQSSKGSSAKAKQPTASAKKQEQDPEDAEPTEAENKAVAAQNQSQTQTTTTSSTSQTSTQSSGYQLDIWEIAYNAKANLHNENWYKQLPGNQWEIAAKITRAVHEAMRNGDPDPVRAGVAAVDPAVAAQREKEAKERAAKEAAAQKNAQEEHEREVRRRQNEANTQAAIQKQKEQQKADQKKAETTRQTLKAQQTNVPTQGKVPGLAAIVPPIKPVATTSGYGAQPQPPRDPVTKKLLPTGNALNAAKWREYEQAMAKWNACRANQGLATVTPTQPPATPTPTPTPVPPSTSYADSLIADWPQMAGLQNLPTDAVVDALVDSFSQRMIDEMGWVSDDAYQKAKGKTDPESLKLVEICEIGRWDADKQKYIRAPRFSTTKIRDAVSALMICASKYSFSSTELAVLLGSAYGEIRFGCEVWPESDTFTDLVEGVAPPTVDDANYLGRGYIQITHKSGYGFITNGYTSPDGKISFEGIGDMYGIDFVEHPEAIANDIRIAAHSSVIALLSGVTSQYKLNDGSGAYEWYGLRQVTKFKFNGETQKDEAYEQIDADGYETKKLLSVVNNGNGQTGGVVYRNGEEINLVVPRE